MTKEGNSDKPYSIEMSIQGSRYCISIGKGVVRALGKPSHVTMKTTDTQDSVSVLACDEDDVMAFRVPTKFFTDHHCVFRIHSKKFVHGILLANGLDISKTYTVRGEYIEDKGTAVFSLTDGVSVKPPRVYKEE